MSARATVHRCDICQRVLAKRPDDVYACESYPVRKREGRRAYNLCSASCDRELDKRLMTNALEKMSLA